MKIWKWDSVHIVRITPLGGSRSFTRDLRNSRLSQNPVFKFRCPRSPQSSALYLSTLGKRDNLQYSTRNFAYTFLNPSIVWILLTSLETLFHAGLGISSFAQNPSPLKATESEFSTLFLWLSPWKFYYHIYTWLEPKRSAVYSDADPDLWIRICIVKVGSWSVRRDTNPDPSRTYTQ